jgi:hypothetical protein
VPAAVSSNIVASSQRRFPSSSRKIHSKLAASIEKHISRDIFKTISRHTQESARFFFVIFERKSGLHY